MAEKIGLVADLDLTAWDYAVDRYIASTLRMEDSSKNLVERIGGHYAQLGAVLSTALAASTAFVAGTGLLAGREMFEWLGEGVVKSSELEQSMADIASVLRTTREEVEPLKVLINDLALDPLLVTSSQEAADVVERLSRNGLTLTDILDGAAEATILMANATGSDYAKSADVATLAMAMFNLEAKDMNTVADISQGVINNSRMELADWALALGNGGAVAETFNVKLEDFATMMALTINDYHSARQAGTGYMNFLMRTVPVTETAADAMRDLGIFNGLTGKEFEKLSGEIQDTQKRISELDPTSKNYEKNLNELNAKLAEQNSRLNAGQNAFFTQEGLYVGNAEAARVLYEATKDLNEEQKIAAFRIIFGNDAMETALAMSKTTAESYNALKEEIVVYGSAAEAAATRTDTLAARTKNLGDIWDAIQRESALPFQETLRELIDLFTELSLDNKDRIIGFFTSMAAQFDALIESSRPWIDEELPKLIQNIEALANVILELITKGDLNEEWLSKMTPGLREFIETTAEVVKWVQDFTEKVREIAGEVGEILGPIADWVFQNVELQDALLAAAGAIAAFLSPLAIAIVQMGAVGAAATLAIATIRTAWEEDFAGLRTTWEEMWVELEEPVKEFADNMKEGDWSAAWESAKEIAITTLEEIGERAPESFQPITDFLTDVLEGEWESAWENAKEIAINSMDGIQSAWDDMQESLKGSSEDPEQGKWAQKLSVLMESLTQLAETATKTFLDFFGLLTSGEAADYSSLIDLLNGIVVGLERLILWVDKAILYLTKFRQWVSGDDLTEVNRKIEENNKRLAEIVQDQAKYMEQEFGGLFDGFANVVEAELKLVNLNVKSGMMELEEIVRYSGESTAQAFVDAWMMEDIPNWKALENLEQFGQRIEVIAEGIKAGMYDIGTETGRAYIDQMVIALSEKYGIAEEAGINLAKNMISSIALGVESNSPVLRDSVSFSVAGSLEGAGDQAGEMAAQVGGMVIGSIQSGIEEGTPALEDSAAQVGGMIMGSVQQGIEEEAPTLKDSTENSIVDSIKQSQEKATTEGATVGGMLMQSVQEGVEEKAPELQERWQDAVMPRSEMTEAMIAEMEALGVSFTDSLTKPISEEGPAKVEEALSQIDGSVEAWSLVLNELMKQLGSTSIQEFISGIAEDHPELAEAFTQIQESIEAWVELFYLVMKELGINAIVNFAQGIQEGAVANQETISTSFTSIFDQMVEALLPEMRLHGTATVTEFSLGIAEGQPILEEQLALWRAWFDPWVEELLTFLKDRGIQAVAEFSAGILESQDILQTQLDALTEMFSAWIELLLTQLNEGGAEGIVKFVEGMESSQQEITQFLESVGEEFDNWLTDMQSSANEGGAEMVSEMAQGMDSTSSSVTDVMEQIKQSILSKIQEMISEATSLMSTMASQMTSAVDTNAFSALGTNIGSAFVSGIQSQVSAAQAAAQQLVDATAAATANAAQIASPSKRFFKQGSQSGEGFVLGWEHQIGNLQKLLTDAVGFASNKLAEISVEYSAPQPIMQPAMAGLRERQMNQVMALQASRASSSYNYSTVNAPIQFGPVNIYNQMDVAEFEYRVEQIINRTRVR